MPPEKKEPDPNDPTTYPCADCAMRQKAETNPRAFLSWLWRVHTKICPGWKAYQRALARQG